MNQSHQVFQTFFAIAHQLKFKDVHEEASDYKRYNEGKTEGDADQAFEACDQRERFLPLSAHVRGQVLPGAKPQCLQSIPLLRNL